MKTIYLVRHAKSDWSLGSLSDIDRPLNARGYTDAHKMSLVLKEKKIFPDLIITSPAIRAISTALIFSRNLMLDSAQITIDTGLYDTNTNEYRAKIAKTDNRFKHIFLFGHNPVITNCANSLTTSFTEEMSTCSIVGIKGNISSWEQFIDNDNELVYYDRPKKSL